MWFTMRTPYRFPAATHASASSLRSSRSTLSDPNSVLIDTDARLATWVPMKRMPSFVPQAGQASRGGCLVHRIFRGRINDDESFCSVHEVSN